MRQNNAPSQFGARTAWLPTVRTTRQLSFLLQLLVVLILAPAATSQERPVLVAPETSEVPGLSPEEVQDRIKDAETLFERGKVDAAIYALQQIQLADPSNTEVLFKLGAMAIQTKNWAYSIQVLRKASLLLPEDVEIRVLLMDIYRAYQMSVQEIMAGREILALNPNHLETLRRLAFLYEDQSMADNELRIRRKLSEIDPQNYENLKRLGFILDKMERPWEAALVYRQITEQFPDKVEDSKTLARLYGISHERYAEIFERRRVLKIPGGKSKAAGRAARGTYFAQKRDRRIYDPFTLPLQLERSTGPTAREDFADLTMGYDRIWLMTNMQFLLKGHVREQQFHPTRFITGDRNIFSNGVVAGFRHSTENNKTHIEFHGGYEDITVKGSTGALDPGDNDIVSFPFLEDREYGGTMAVADFELSYEFTPHSGIRFQALRAPVQELDAYVRLLARHSASAFLSYRWPNQTYVEGGYEQSWYSDNNRRRHAIGQFSYPIYLSNSVIDLNGMRHVPIHPTPDSQIRVGYQFDAILDSQSSSLYETYVGTPERRHAVTLIAQRRIGGRIFFYAEGIWGQGQFQDRLRGWRGGLVYENPLLQNILSITYGTVTDRTRDQLNANLEGSSRTQSLLVSMIWHFGTSRREGELQIARRRSQSRRR